ncbi:DUF6313 family protein [Actinacidiphila bryophytorum]|uniref:DUF6313 family protein n=1 Tax=Actinacidiphila bryophytorum TaxID=1436133 RepID=UPI002176C761|nr:DUF6313 family protein [Actinacidiphila bryophytorum]UWE08594.1 DUF6313 family protein [Actinacidiphila bryophytorum]
MPISSLPIPLSLTAPPPQTLGARIRRVFRSRKALSGLTQWVVDWGIPMAVVVSVVYVFAVRSRGADAVYRTFTLIDAPDHTLLWIASLTGWLLVPAIIGGIAGHVIAARIQNVKELPDSDMFKRRTLAERLRPPDRIHLLADYFAKGPAEQDFVDLFVRTVHRNHWRLAQDHWEILVRDHMRTDDFAPLGRIDCLRQAHSTAKVTVVAPSTIGVCPVCAVRQS